MRTDQTSRPENPGRDGNPRPDIGWADVLRELRQHKRNGGAEDTRDRVRALKVIAAAKREKLRDEIRHLENQQARGEFSPELGRNLQEMRRAKRELDKARSLWTPAKGDVQRQPPAPTDPVEKVKQAEIQRLRKRKEQVIAVAQEHKGRGRLTTAEFQRLKGAERELYDIDLKLRGFQGKLTPEESRLAMDTARAHMGRDRRNAVLLPILANIEANQSEIDRLEQRSSELLKKNRSLSIDERVKLNQLYTDRDKLYRQRRPFISRPLPPPPRKVVRDDPNKPRSWEESAHRARVGVATLPGELAAMATDKLGTLPFFGAPAGWWMESEDRQIQAAFVNGVVNLIPPVAATNLGLQVVDYAAIAKQHGPKKAFEVAVKEFKDSVNFLEPNLSTHEKASRMINAFFLARGGIKAIKEGRVRIQNAQIVKELKTLGLTNSEATSMVKLAQKQIHEANVEQNLYFDRWGNPTKEPTITGEIRTRKADEITSANPTHRRNLAMGSGRELQQAKVRGTGPYIREGVEGVSKITPAKVPPTSPSQSGFKPIIRPPGGVVPKPTTGLVRPGPTTLVRNPATTPKVGGNGAPSLPTNNGGRGKVDNTLAKVDPGDPMLKKATGTGEVPTGGLVRSDPGDRVAPKEDNLDGLNGNSLKNQYQLLSPLPDDDLDLDLSWADNPSVTYEWANQGLGSLNDPSVGNLGKWRQGTDEFDSDFDSTDIDDGAMSDVDVMTNTGPSRQGTGATNGTNVLQAIGRFLVEHGVPDRPAPTQLLPDLEDPKPAPRVNRPVEPNLEVFQRPGKPSERDGTVKETPEVQQQRQEQAIEQVEQAVQQVVEQGLDQQTFEQLPAPVQALFAAAQRAGSVRAALRQAAAQLPGSGGGRSSVAPLFAPFRQGRVGSEVRLSGRVGLPGRLPSTGGSGGTWDGTPDAPGLIADGRPAGEWSRPPGDVAKSIKRSTSIFDQFITTKAPDQQFAVQKIVSGDLDANGWWDNWNNIITIDPDGPTPGLTTLHELGHVVLYHDYGHFANNERTTRLYQSLLETIRKTPTFTTWEAQTLKPKLKADAEYLCKDVELFARAFSQLLAERSRDPELGEELQKCQIENVRIKTQWDSDFRMIRPAMEKFLNEIGVLKN